MKVVYVSSEVAPYAKTGGLADVSGSLPKALLRKGAEVLTFLPRYRGTDIQRVVVNDLRVPFAFGDKPASVAVDERHGFPVHFIDQPEYFDRAGIYGDRANTEYGDNAERFAVFCRAGLEGCRRIGFRHDVLL